MYAKSPRSQAVYKTCVTVLDMSNMHNILTTIDKYWTSFFVTNQKYMRVQDQIRVSLKNEMRFASASYFPKGVQMLEVDQCLQKQYLEKHM